ncbi:hypothetical protein SPRG_11901 [Saprolegnia parasitica CBS 223.65]|uniref:Uncharacterized protein n=1 Tax=Saprolegnia parasitica (strain CBS 223.65) TaxID=695850 RepID=A0A067BWZ6_SAPPC|nr:hypothetical protein SPRG_11901 [Saprolegnia parasitica CBS 223.65]KDO23054.1 hypothetical protein SPRG_11901 [Saprolegnia parasitica CBS 223.65]|eukprot:XP_012206171.1 hypothetical protein SPRG_11901 [Saprolegnia parasitica CBS 223.65]
MLSVYAIFHTAYSFHSCWENIVGMLIAQVFVMLPLYLVSEDYFGALHFGAFLTKDRRLAK